MTVEIINEENNSLIFSDVFNNQQDYYANNINNFSDKFNKGLIEYKKKLDNIVENQKRISNKNIYDFWINKIKDLIDFEWLENWVWYMSNNEFIDTEELKLIKNDNSIDTEHWLSIFNQKFKSSLNLCKILWEYEIDVFNEKKCEDYIQIKQFFIINTKSEATLYDLGELSEMYFNEIYGITNDGKNLYNFSSNKIVFISYSFSKKQFLVEIIDYKNGNNEKNIIVNKDSELFTFFDFENNSTKINIKQYFIKEQDLNNFDIKLLLEIEKDEIVIDDKSIIRKNTSKDEKAINYLSYNYYIEFFERIIKIDKVISNTLNENWINELKFNIDDVCNIETAFWNDIIKLKKDLGKIIKKLQLDDTKKITVKSEAELEWLYDSLWTISVENNNVDFEDLYKIMINQVIIHYMVFYTEMKFNNVVNILSKYIYTDFLQFFENLEIIINVKQSDHEEEIKLSIS